MRKKFQILSSDCQFYPIHSRDNRTYDNLPPPDANESSLLNLKFLSFYKNTACTLLLRHKRRTEIIEMLIIFRVHVTNYSIYMSKLIKKCTTVFTMFVSIIRNKITRCVQCIAQDEQMIPFIHEKGRGNFLRTFTQRNPQFSPLFSME